MKKALIAVLLAAALSLTACGGGNAAPAADPKPVETEAETEDLGPYYISPSHTGLLHVEDGKLCDADGNQIQLKGVSTHAITRCQPYQNAAFFEEMRNDWGVNIIRLAMYVSAQDGYTKNDLFKETNTKLVKQGIELATKADMYVIVDWHVLDEKTPLRYQDEALSFFDQISSEYADHDNIFYEICNEPNNTPWEDIKAYAEAVIPVIRANDPDAVIICGTPDWSQGVDQALADPLDFDNVMYTLHFYAASHKDELRNRMIDCAKAGLPIFVTEYGVTADSGGVPRDLDESDRWMAALDEYGISSCIWCLAKDGQACNLFVNTTMKTSGFEEEDLNDTGKWFVDMIGKYKAAVSE